MPETGIAVFPDSPKTVILARVTEFLKQGRGAGSHQAKLVVLTNFFKDVFDVKVDDLLPGIEKKVGSRILGARGSIDLLYSAVVIELKVHYDAERAEALAELTKYFQSLKEADPKRRYVGLATDLVQFELFAPKFDGIRVVGIETVDTFDTRSKTAQEALLWLDSVLISGQTRIPTADEIDIKFGPISATFAVGSEILSTIWTTVRTKKPNQLKLRIWTRIMEIVYGKAPHEDAFTAQTYLSMLTKLLVYLKLESAPLTNRADVEAVLSGRFFIERGIVNLIEEDFFSWVLDSDIVRESEDLAMGLARALQVYDLELADEDLFKELYQKIVGIHARHGAGEFYTPRWLCEYALEVLLRRWNQDEKAFPRLLDPACGSGSFLTAAIHALRNKLKDVEKTVQLQNVLHDIVGVDFNPIAVTIARANYVIALGDLVRVGERISVPIYVADSVKLPELRPTIYGKMKVYDLEVDGEHIVLPETIFDDPERRVKALGLLSDALSHYHEEANKSEAEAIFLREAQAAVSSEELEVLKGTLATLLKMVDQESNSIWLFVLNNLYTPVVLQENPFDVIIGNPPWLVMRSIENKEYQQFLKEQVLDYKLLDQDQIKLYTHMEMATLFFRRASQLYLRNGGFIEFVMPISITSGAMHHRNFNRFERPEVRLLEISRFGGVPGIFSLPPCVLIAKKGEATIFPVPITDWKGSLAGRRRNAPLDEILPILTPLKGEYMPAEVPKGVSYYFPLFKEGATIVPHNFWFVEPVLEGRLGLDRTRPLVETSREAERVAKRRWKGKKIRGQVEARFIYAGYLGKDLLSFGTLPPRLIVLPLAPAHKKWKLWDVDELRSGGYPLMGKWLKEAQKLWENHASAKSKTMFPRVLNRVNYQNTLTGQNSQKRYVVVYNARGANAFSVVIDRENLPTWKFGAISLRPSDFVADSTNFYYETDDDTEAHYLCAVLNAPCISEAVKPFQPVGAYGPRDIGRRPLMLSIPKYDPKDAAHLLLAKLSLDAHAIVGSMKFSGPGFRTRRNEAIQSLSSLTGQIDHIVESLGMSELAAETLGAGVQGDKSELSALEDLPDGDDE